MGLRKGVDTGGALGASAPPDFEAQYILYIGIRVFVVHKVPTKVERLQIMLCQVMLQLYATPESS